MANVKENELPVAGSISNSDYIRIVTSGGASERISTNNLAANIPGMADYVKEQGTTNGWFYRKWSDGRIEAWKEMTGTLTPYSTWNGFSLYKVENIALPFTMKDTHYYLAYGWKVGSGLVYPATQNYDKQTTTFSAFAAGSATGTNLAYILTIYIHGELAS